MKTSIVVMVLQIFYLAGFSQSAAMPVDERGKYTFLEVTELPVVKKEAMSANAKRFFKSTVKSIKLNASKGDTAFYGTGKMILTKNLAGIGHPSAEARYNLSLELRNGRYRLILTDFVVTPYERDRYGNFVPMAVGTALEKPPGKLNRADWNKNMGLIAETSKKIAGKLKDMMSNKAKDPDTSKPITVSTIEW